MLTLLTVFIFSIALLSALLSGKAMPYFSSYSFHFLGSGSGPPGAGINCRFPTRGVQFLAKNLPAFGRPPETFSLESSILPPTDFALVLTSVLGLLRLILGRTVPPFPFTNRWLRESLPYLFFFARSPARFPPTATPFQPAALA